MKSLSQLELRAQHLRKKIAQGLLLQGSGVSFATQDDGTARAIRAFLFLQTSKLPVTLDYEQLESIVRTTLRELGGKRPHNGGMSKAILVTLVRSIVRSVHSEDALLVLCLLYTSPSPRD